MTSEESEVALSGGNMNAVVRRGDAVHRTAGPWTPTIHRLLQHLHEGGVEQLPRPLGYDEQGREVLTYLSGTVPAYPMPPWVWTEPVLLDAGALLARVHAASAGFPLEDAIWQLPGHEPPEVICLNDVAPYNMVFDSAHRLVGIIDLDTASPGPRVWDLAYLAYRLVPLSHVEETGAGTLSLVTRGERLRRLCAAYAEAGDRVAVDPTDVLATAVDRLRDLADFTAARAAAGAVHVADHVRIYEGDAAWITAHLDRL